MKLDYNFHNHTSRCGHALKEDRDYIEAALKANMASIGFSDHTYIKGYVEKGIRMNEELFPDYLSSIHSLKEEYKDRIDISLGLEAEYSPYMMEEYKRLLKENTLDYLILGQHMRLIDPNNITNYFKLGPKRALHAYLEDLTLGMESGLFTIIAHPDLFGYFYPYYDDFIISRLHSFLKEAKELDVILELNISKLANNIRYGKDMFYNTPFPHWAFWDLVAYYDIKVAIGLDAHNPRSYLDSPYEWALSFIKEKHLNLVTKEMIKERMQEIKNKLK